MITSPCIYPRFETVSSQPPCFRLRRQFNGLVFQWRLYRLAGAAIDKSKTRQSAFQPPEAAKCCYTLCDSGHGVNNNVFYFSFSSSQLWAARLKRIRTPACATSRRGRTTTLTGCCFGRTVRRTPAPTCCGVSLNESYLIKRGPRSSVATKPGFPPILLCLTL